MTWRSALLLAAACACVATDVSAAENRWQLSVSPVAGAIVWDRHLDDYKWDPHPAFFWGGEALLRRGRVAAGLRAWRAGTFQSSGIPGGPDALDVRLTAATVLGEYRAATYAGMEMWGTAHTGLVHIGYRPDALDVDLGGGAGTVSVSFDAIDTWEAGAGVRIRRPIGKVAALSLHGGLSSFALDTAHRSGTEIVEANERFVNWTLAAQVSWAIGFQAGH